eukprot:1179125-Prorocentrum_minimum.AAC.2
MDTSHSRDGPIRRRPCGYIPTTDQSNAGSVGIFSRRTNQTQEVWVYSHDGPIKLRKCGYILTMNQSDAVSVGIFSRRTNQTLGNALVIRERGPAAKERVTRELLGVFAELNQQLIDPSYK